MGVTNSIIESYGHNWHCVKIVRIWSFSGRYFPVFSPNAKKYGPEKLRIRTLFTQCGCIIFELTVRDVTSGIAGESTVKLYKKNVIM